MARDAFDETAERWADQQRGYAKFVARYWADDRFRAEAQRNPARALAQAGFDVAEGARLRLVEIDESESVIVIPRTQRSFEVPDIDFSHCFGTVGTLGTVACIGGTAGTAATFGTSGSFNPCYYAEAENRDFLNSAGTLWMSISTYQCGWSRPDQGDSGSEADKADGIGGGATGELRNRDTDG